MKYENGAYKAKQFTSPSSRGRGLKSARNVKITDNVMSPSSRGRGLKYLFFLLPLGLSLSPSSRGRGLKYIMFFVCDGTRRVALFTRAWIEIKDYRYEFFTTDVALFTRAWIEIDVRSTSQSQERRRPLHEGVD